MKLLKKVEKALQNQFEVKKLNKHCLLIRHSDEDVMRVFVTKSVQDRLVISVSVSYTDSNVVALLCEFLFNHAQCQITSPFFSASHGMVHGDEAYLYRDLESDADLLMQLASPSEYKN
jgi:hypothetical protein